MTALVWVAQDAVGCTHLLVDRYADDDPDLAGRCRWCRAPAVVVPEEDLEGFQRALDARLRREGAWIDGVVQGGLN